MQREIEDLLIKLQIEMEDKMRTCPHSVVQFYCGYVEGLRHARHAIDKYYENLF